MITLLIRSGVTAPYSCSDATTFYIPEPISMFCTSLPLSSLLPPPSSPLPLILINSDLTANVTVLQYPTSQGNGTFVINAFGGHGPYRYEVWVQNSSLYAPSPLPLPFIFPLSPPPSLSHPYLLAFCLFIHRST